MIRATLSCGSLHLLYGLFTWIRTPTGSRIPSKRAVGIRDAETKGGTASAHIVPHCTRSTLVMQFYMMVVMIVIRL